jgi:hypothetical protein
MSEVDRQEATHRHVRRAAHLITSQLSDRPAIAIGTLAGALGVSEPDAAELVRTGAVGEASEMFGEWRVTVAGYEAYRRNAGRSLPEADAVLCSELDGFAADRLDELVAFLHCGPRAGAYRP